MSIALFRKLCYTYVILLPFKTSASFFMHVWLVILSFIDDKFTEWSKSTNVNEIIYTFNDGSTDSTEILEKLFKKPIAEIRSDEGNCLSYPERQMETKKRREKGKKRPKCSQNFTLLQKLLLTNLDIIRNIS